MKISALVPTYGRFSLLCETLAFFLMQDHEDKELVILNDGPEAITCQSPAVRVLNVSPQPNLGTIWEQLRDAATGELISIWTDDDWYLPWHLSIAHDHLKKTAWKPARSWCCMMARKDFTLSGNVFESSITMKRDAFKLKQSYGEEFVDQVHAMQAMGELTTDELGWMTPYVFLWENGGSHVSGSIGNGTDEARRDAWRKATTDFPDGQELTPDFEGALNRFTQLLEGTKNKLPTNEWEKLRNKLDSIACSCPL